MSRAPEPGHERARRALVLAVRVAPTLERLPLVRRDAGDAPEEEADDRRADQRHPPAGRADRRDHVRPPVQPLEEVVRMPRVAPQPRLEDGPLGRRVGAEGGELPVGGRLADHRDRPDGDRDPRPHAQPGVVPRHDEKGKRHDGGAEPLHLEEDEQPHLRLRSPLRAQRLVATFLLLAADAVEVDVQRQARRPDAGEDGHQQTLRRVAAGEHGVEDGEDAEPGGPADVDPAGGDLRPLDEPEDAHHDRHEGPADEHQGARVHRASSWIRSG